MAPFTWGRLRKRELSAEVEDGLIPLQAMNGQ